MAMDDAVIVRVNAALPEREVGEALAADSYLVGCMPVIADGRSNVRFPTGVDRYDSNERGNQDGFQEE